MNKKVNILICEDNPVIANELQKILSNIARTFIATNYDQCKKLLDTQMIQLAFIDLNLGVDHMEGINLVKICNHLKITSIVLTNYEDKEVIGQAFMAGCQSYHLKDDFIEKSSKYLPGIIRQIQSSESTNILQNHYITQDAHIKSQLEYLSQHPLDNEQQILILGETGVGKTKLAKLVHHLSGSAGELIHQNLLEIPENLFESTLFGHTKGSFTGAHSDKKGLLELANNGTLFLDEIGALPLKTQKKLLRVLEDKSFTPVGSNQKIQVNFKLITATCDDIPKKIESGELRLDFYFRIKGIELFIPPLRKRIDDIPLLIDHILSKSSKKIFIQPDVIEQLKRYPWPGNIRELASLLKQFLNSPKGLINMDSLPPHIKKINTMDINTFIGEKSIELEQMLTPDMKSRIKEFGLNSFIKCIEKEAMLMVMKENKGRINQVQRSLQVSKSLLYRIHQELIDEYGEAYFKT